MTFLPIALVASLILCSLVAGLLFAFAVVVMPGIRTLGDQEFLRAFKVMDGIIQKRAPLFMIAWLGSIIALLVALSIAVLGPHGVERVLIVLASALYLVGVQLPTFTINVPLNNRLQSEDLDTLSSTELKSLRHEFESSWVRWNQIRTVAAVLTTGVLAVVLMGG